MKYNLVLRKSLTKTLDDTMKTAEAKYSINFSGSWRKFFTKKKRINMNRVGANVDSMKGWGIQSKNEIMINWMIGVPSKRAICRILVRVIATVIKHVRLMNVYILKTALVKIV